METTGVVKEMAVEEITRALTEIGSSPFPESDTKHWAIDISEQASEQLLLLLLLSEVLVLVCTDLSSGNERESSTNDL